MADFPKLKTGVSVQYPIAVSAVYRTRITRFVDGSEQRYGELAQPVRRWAIQLDLLDEDEARRLQAFFGLQQGGYGVFSFEDPHTGQTYSSCSFETDGCTIEQQGENRSRTTMIVRTVA